MTCVREGQLVERCCTPADVDCPGTLSQHVTQRELPSGCRANVSCEQFCEGRGHAVRPTYSRLQRRVPSEARCSSAASRCWAAALRSVQTRMIFTDSA